jgi:hypothetical protein
MKFLSEASYQAHLIKKLSRMFPGCFVIRNDSTYLQGIPDLLVLFGSNWAMLEVKLTDRACVQPNQEYYVDMFNEMSYSSFVYPENEEQVLNELQLAFGSYR